MKDNLRKSLHLIEQGIDKVRIAFKKSRGYSKDILLLAYHGYSTNDKLYIQGRVLEDRGIKEAKADDNIYQNIARMYKHFGSKEIPEVSVSAIVSNKTYSAISDEEGYFNFEIPIHAVEPKTELWQSVPLHLTEGQDIEAEQVAWIQNSLPESQFGIISDIDDTIIDTGAHSLFNMLKTTFTQNEHTRNSFPGVSELYAALQKGKQEKASNPIFYLSNSPWNLYDFLDDFMELKNIPKGSIHLRDYGLDENKMIVDDQHKLNTIRKLLNTYPSLPFILIGDSGEKDPEYYQEITKEFPERILAIYIRDVTNEPRDSEVKKIAESVNSVGTPMFLMDNSDIAMEHAKSMNWIV